VLPATREATLVHMIDNLGGRLGSFDRLEKELRDGERWSGFDRALGGGAFFGGAPPPADTPVAFDEPEQAAA
jgi:3'-5' exoribonuclease